jgi:hypothetical protein
MTVSLSRFELYILGPSPSYTDQIYGNGNQQCTVEVHVLKEGSQPAQTMPLSAAELASLTLVPYSTDLDGVLDTGWSCDQVSKGFDQGLHDRSRNHEVDASRSRLDAERQPDSKSAFQIVKRYLRADGVAAVSTRFMARIRLDDGAIYTTHFDDGNRAYESSITINPQRPYVLRVQDLTPQTDDAYANSNVQYIEFPVLHPITEFNVSVRTYFWTLPTGLWVHSQSTLGALREDPKLIWAFGRKPGDENAHRGAVIRQEVTALTITDFAADMPWLTDNVPLKLVARSMRALWCHFQLRFPDQGPVDMKLDWSVTDNFGCVHYFKLQASADSQALELVDSTRPTSRLLAEDISIATH